MLKNLDGKLMARVPHQEEFDEVVERLGRQRAGEVRAALNTIIDEMPPARNMPHRAFNSSFLGSSLSPWHGGLGHLYTVASEILEGAPDNIIEERAALIFGLFVWECMMQRDEEVWHFWNPNLSQHDPNREPMGKFYFEVAE